MDDECVQNCAQEIDTIQGCDMGMDKFAGLYKRGGVWWIDIRFPPGYPVKELAGKRIRNSLVTFDPKAAQQIRDRLVGPVVAASGEAELADTLIRFASNAARRLADALATAADEIPALRKAAGGSVRIAAVKGDPTLCAVCDGWLNRLRKGGNVKPASVEKYSSGIAMMVFCMGDLSDAPLNELDIQSFQTGVEVGLSLPFGWQYCEPRTLSEHHGYLILSF